MGTIQTLDTAVRTIVLKKLKRHDAIIKAEVVKGAKKKGFDVTVKKITLVKVDLDTKKVQDIRLGKIAVAPNETEIVLYSMEYENNSDTIDTATFSYDKERADSWHWEMKAGVTVEYKTEIKVPLTKGPHP